MLVALDQVMRTASPDATRYALQRVQLRGRTGDIVATDSKTLMCSTGFEFGWTEDLLVSRTLAFGNDFRPRAFFTLSAASPSRSRKRTRDPGSRSRSPG